MPTFLGFPAGGLVAEVVGRVDSPAPAIAGGAITGAILGFAQWVGMRRTGPSPIAWIIATAAGFAVGLGLGAAVAGYHTNTSALATQGAICGAVIGAAQAAVLYRQLGRSVLAWPAALAGLWALGWTITASAGIDVEAQYTTFGASGALVVTAAMSILPIELARHGNRVAQ
jgi:peptidoglycan/LPS O-acetylase OafA/YrhL